MTRHEAVSDGELGDVIRSDVTTDIHTECMTPLRHCETVASKLLIHCPAHRRTKCGRAYM
jgi:hypothetical protein